MSVQSPSLNSPCCVPAVWLVDLKNRRFLSFYEPDETGYHGETAVDLHKPLAVPGIDDAELNLGQLF